MAAGKLSLLGLTLLLMACSAEAPPRHPPERLPVTIGGRTFQLELALTQEAQQKGLSHRDHLDSDGGMLFAFRHVRMREFWMKDCLVPIDIIFLDPAGRILAMHAMTPEPGVADGDLKRYSSKWAAQFALELPGGTLKTLHLKPNETIDLPLADLKRWAE